MRNVERNLTLEALRSWRQGCEPTLVGSDKYSELDQPLSTKRKTDGINICHRVSNLTLHLGLLKVRGLTTLGKNGPMDAIMAGKSTKHHV